MATSYHVCYHCKNRKIGCHSTCDLYIKERAERDEMLKQEHEQKEINETVYGNERKRRKSIKRNKRKIK